MTAIWAPEDTPMEAVMYAQVKHDLEELRQAVAQLAEQLAGVNEIWWCEQPDDEVANELIPHAYEAFQEMLARLGHGDPAGQDKTWSKMLAACGVDR